MINKIVKKVVDKLGYKIEKKRKFKNLSPFPQSKDPMEEGLARIVKNIGPVKTVIDVGAAAGTWFEKGVKYFPSADFVLFEPLIERKAELENLRNKHSNITLKYSALGKDRSSLKFTVTDDLDGSGFYGNGNQRDVEVDSLDNVLKEEKKDGPYILKLDTHGFEIPIIEGAEATLKKTALIIVEVYGFYVAPNSLLFWQICQFLDERGFRLVDMIDIMRRQQDDAFWQCDAFFINKTNPIFSNNSYK
jgi:FkbM family methyltransferase